MGVGTGSACPVWDRLTEITEKYYRFFLIAEMGLVIFLCFYRLGVQYVVSWDEARFGVNAYEMLKSGNFFMNTFRYEPDYWNLKPPLSMYGTALSFAVFGVGKFGLRAFSALSYVVLCLVSALFVRRRFGALASLFAVGFLCANNACFSFHMIRSGDADSLYVLFFTLSMLCMLMIPERPGMLYGAGFFFACAFLTKSWHAGTIVGIGFLYLLLTGELRRMTGKRWGLFLLSFLLPIGIWAGLRYTQDGVEFFREMIVYELLTSSQEAIENHAQEFLFYINNYFLDTWRQYSYLAALLICGAGALWYRRQIAGKEHGRRSQAIGIALWFVIPLLFFTLAATKLVWYAYASLIPLLLAAGIFAGRAVSDRGLPGWARTAVFAVAAGVICVYAWKNVETIQSVYPNDFHDFFQEADEAAPQYGERHIYLGGDGEFGYGNWSQDTSFLAEIYGDHVCIDGGVEAFLADEEPSVLIVNRDYYEAFREQLSGYTIAYQNEKYYYIAN